MNRFDLATLHLLVLIADSGSMTEAARKASLTLAAVSKRVVDLERELQLQLFTRRKTGVLPTEAGRAVIAQARQVVYDFDRLDEELNEFRVGRLGTVRVGANAAAMTQFLPEDLASFFEKHPEIRIDLTELPSDAIVKRLIDGRLELGVFADREMPLQIQTFPYRSHRLCAIVRHDSELVSRKRIAFEAISGMPIIGLEGGSSLLQLLHRRASRALNVPVQARSFDVVCRFVQAGLGIGIVPTRTAEMYAPVFRLHILRLTDEWARRETLIGVRSVETLTPSAKSLLSILRESRE